MSQTEQELQGTDLREAVLAGRIGPEAAIPLVLKLATALAASGDRNHARPKVRPRNIRVDAAGDPVQLEGSMLPAAPEGPGSRDERADVFALGITALFVLHGRDLPRNVLSRLHEFVHELHCPEPIAQLLAQACAPDPRDRLGTLAELRDRLAELARTSGSFPAIAADEEEACQLLLRQDATRLQPYRTLFRIYEAHGQVDQAYCVARALSLLGNADAEHRRYLEHFKQAGPVRPKAVLDEARWIKDLMHPGENLLVGKLLATITPAVLALQSNTDRALGLKAEQWVRDPESSTVTLVRSFVFVGRALGLPVLPRLFLCPDRDGGASHMPARPPAMACGKALLSGLDPVDLTFMLARHLCDLRPEHYIRTLLAPRDLEGALCAARALAGVDAPHPERDSWLARLRPHLGQAEQAQLTDLGARFPKLSGPLDLGAFLHAVELTAYRTAFLMCGDLDIAGRLAAGDPRLAHFGLTPKDVLRELLVFGVSAPYFRLRTHLGVQVG